MQNKDRHVSRFATVGSVINSALIVVFVSLLLCVMAPDAQAQRGGGRGNSSLTAQASAQIDMEGYWVSVVTEDWKLRMVTPNPGVFDGLPLNTEGRRVGNSWDPDAVEAAGLECQGYGAPAIMRLPGRFHITWPDENTLRIDTDYGTQTRLFNFAPSTPGEPSRQGHSVAEWQGAPGGGGGLKVVTNNLTEGYIRKNGAPYSDQAVLTEYYDLHLMPNGDQWLNITTHVVDPIYFSRPAITTTDLKKLPNDQGWNPTLCSAR